MLIITYYNWWRQLKLLIWYCKRSIRCVFIHWRLNLYLIHFQQILILNIFHFIFNVVISKWRALGWFVENWKQRFYSWDFVRTLIINYIWFNFFSYDWFCLFNFCWCNFIWFWKCKVRIIFSFLWSFLFLFLMTKFSIYHVLLIERFAKFDSTLKSAHYFHSLKYLRKIFSYLVCWNFLRGSHNM